MQMTLLFNSIDKTKSSVQRQQLCDTLNRDLQCIQEWGQRWLVFFNSSKTKGLIHSRSIDRSQHPWLQMPGSNLVEQEGISLLGLTVCSDLSWRQYLQSIFKQASQRVGCLYRASLSTSSDYPLSLQIDSASHHGELLPPLGRSSSNSP